MASPRSKLGAWASGTAVALRHAFMQIVEQPSGRHAVVAISTCGVFVLEADERYQNVGKLRPACPGPGPGHEVCGAAVASVVAR